MQFIFWLLLINILALWLFGIGLSLGRCFSAINTGQVVTAINWFLVSLLVVTMGLFVATYSPFFNGLLRFAIEHRT